MVKIRLSRLGAKKRPFYSVVAIDHHARRDGRPLEYLGTYNPIATPKQILLDGEKIDDLERLVALHDASNVAAVSRPGARSRGA